MSSSTINRLRGLQVALLIYSLIQITIHSVVVISCVLDA